MRVTFRVLVAASVLWFGHRAQAQQVGADGSLSYTYSFPLPPARGRYQPVLSLAYNSNAGMSAIGAGWSLSENYIEIVSRATPQLSGARRSRYFIVLNGARQLILPAPDGSYRPDVADAFFKLTPSGAPSITSWTATDSVGNTYSYSCLADEVGCTRWYLKQVTDVDGNKTVYAFDAPPGSATTSLVESQECRNELGQTLGNRTAALLTSISYNYNMSGTAVHTVSLTYTNSAPTGPRRGIEAIDDCLVTHDQLLTSVTVNRNNLALVSYDVVQTISSDTGRALLDHIQRRDRAGAALGLPTTFRYESDLPGLPPTDNGTTYSVSAPTTATNLVAPAQWSNPLSTLTLNQCNEWMYGQVGAATFYGGSPYCGYADVGTWLDMDGDGLPDLVWGGYDVDGGSGIRWARNLSNQNGNATGTVGTIEILSGSATWAGYLGRSNPSGSSEMDDGPYSTYEFARFIDVNGDGLPDLVSSSGGRQNLCGQFHATTGSYSYSSIAVQFASLVNGRPSYGPITCLDASLPYNEFQQDLPGAANTSIPLSYNITMVTPLDPQAAVTETIVDFTDMTGDGLPDFVLVYGLEWHVYPGHKTQSGGWAFGTDDPYQPYLIRKPLSPALSYWGDFPIRGKDLNGHTIVDLSDVNGDGLPDRVVMTSTGWSVDYNTSAAFSSTGVGFFQSPSSSSASYILMDMNNDGVPDYVTQGDTTCAGNLYVRFNQGGGFSAPACFPYQGTPANRFVDLDGDGVVDFLPEWTVGGTTTWAWNFYRGQQVQRRSDLLVSISASSGAAANVQWGPSSVYMSGAGSGMQRFPRTASVVTAISTSGPALSPLTTSYVYAWPLYDVVPDDPNRTQLESLGFNLRYELPSVGGLVRHVRYGNSHFTNGLPVIVETGVLMVANGFNPPSYSTFARTEVTWSARQVGALDCSAWTYPAYRYPSQTIRSRIEGNITLQSKVVNGCPDANGNVITATSTADTLSSEAVVVNRRFSTSLKCVTCVLEEWAQLSGAASDLYHRYYRYDVAGYPQGSINPSTAPASSSIGVVVNGHLAYVEHLAFPGSTSPLPLSPITPTARSAL